MSEEFTVPETTQTPTKKKSPTILIAIIAVVAILALAIWGISALLGGKSASKESEKLELFPDGLVVATDESGKKGYADKDGNIVIPCQFSSACQFSEGIACVRVDGRSGYINTKGEYVIPLQFHLSSSGCHDGLVQADVEGKKFGYMDKTGKYVINPIYDNARRFSEGFAAVKTNGKWGYIDTKGKQITDFIFDEVQEFSEGLAAVKIGEKWGYINAKGETVIQLQFDYTWKFSENMSYVKVGNKYGFIDKEGSYIANPIYDSAKSFSEGFAPVKVGDLWGYIDKNGTQVIAPRYSHASSFSHGLSAIRENGKWGYVNKKGEMVIESPYGQAFTILDDGYGYMPDENKRYYAIDANGKRVMSNGFVSLNETFTRVCIEENCFETTEYYDNYTHCFAHRSREYFPGCNAIFCDKKAATGDGRYCEEHLYLEN